MKAIGAGILILTLLTAIGCEDAQTPAGGVSPTTRPTNPFEQDSTALLNSGKTSTGPQRTVYLINIQLATVEVPLGVASGSEELWSHLDEEPVSLHSRALGMNGFRVGIGREDDWNDIERTLKKMTGQSYKSVTIQAAAGRPAPVELQANQPTKLLFVTQEDQTLTGRHIFPGDYLLTITCTLDEDDPSKVLMTIMPQIRSTRRHPQIIHEHGIKALVNLPVFETLTSMAFQLTVPNNDFLIIGPGILARRPTSPGQAFLMKDRDGVPFETVVLLRPMVHAVQMNKSPRK